jgi:hypothetical protein
MRLGFPRIKNLQTDDGTASIAFQSTSMDRDTGGFEYLFRFRTSSGETEVRATVARVTGGPAARKLAESGTDLWSLKTEGIEKYINKYVEEYGNTFEVVIFAVPANASDNDIVALRDAFCALFFKNWSLYKYNNTDDTSDPAELYPDTINFLPYDLDRRFHVTVHARQGGYHD